MVAIIINNCDTDRVNIIHLSLQSINLRPKMVKQLAYLTDGGTFADLFKKEIWKFIFKILHFP